MCTYRAFQGFGQAKFPNDGLLLGSSPFSLLSQAGSKNDDQFKSGQNRPKNNHSVLLV